MRTPFRASITALALTGGTVLGVTAPAHAADPVVWYVRQLSTACSDTGSGTLEQPFCTIGAAAAVVAEGQTVDVGGGAYRERVTIATSGTTFRAATSGGPTLIGNTAGFVIDGQHDITLQGMRVNVAEDSPLPALDVRDAAGITVDGGSFGIVNTRNPTMAVRLTGVTGALLKPGSIAGGVSIDATSSGVTVSNVGVSGANFDPGFPAVGVQVSGRNNKIVNNRINGFAGAAVVVDPDAVDTVVANNHVNAGPGLGIHNRGGAGTAITNNTVRDRCADGIRVDGASSGVSVQNNMLILNGGSGFSGCGGVGVEIGIHDGAVGHTVVDYNNAYHYSGSSPSLYAWNGTPMSLAAFRTASGQSTHDLETSALKDAYDAANSAAPGYQATDRFGVARVDDLGVPDRGAGPVTYADRGAVETYTAPRPRGTFTVDLAARSVTVDASTSTPGVAPIASYTFDFGDGTVVTQTSPVATHQYVNPGEYTIQTGATGTDGRAASTAEIVSVLRSTATMGLLSLHNLRYVAPAAAGTALAPSQAGLTGDGQVDLADAGSGHVALVLRSTGKYISVDIPSGRGALTWTRTKVENTERWILVRNADGSISFRSVATNNYISLESQATPHLIVNRSAVSGPWEKFHQVRVADADRSLKSQANGKYVTAEDAGAKPLIANRVAAGSWERFDLVDLGNGQVALLARANNKFVAAESSGTKPLLAGRVAVGAWERYTLVRNSDGTISLRAAANNNYVCAESAGTKPLIASRPAINTWEKFTLG